ncbi:uncharacterized protein GIQ15_03051 [Arthroderma uncinatum]|uniref:uncharacterized protein n=1 Tax=Arthroderma uncinatum TaxID=74035 RepID=UPI00144AE69F|nr:uncharacterized protein GIQ15_03051 [Arthroderma uncinatum]KAF3483727.1 hypothetical protein GIQ15_03051 [Arthroderma uncinatum]
MAQIQLDMDTQPYGVTGKGLIEARMPDLVYGPGCTKHKSTHATYFVSRLGEWTGFEKEVKDTFESLPWTQETLDFSAKKLPKHNMSQERLRCGDEHSVLARFGQNAGAVVSCVLASLGKDICFADAKACIDSTLGTAVPDIVMMTEPGELLVVGEAKTPWRHDFEDTLLSGSRRQVHNMFASGDSRADNPMIEGDWCNAKYNESDEESDDLPESTTPSDDVSMEDAESPEQQVPQERGTGTKGTTAMDPSMNSLLKWGIENTIPSGQTNGNETPAASRSIDAEALQRLLANTPSDAELMKTAMEVVRSSEATLENKLIAFDNFEQLVENLDNANNMDPLGLWAPLVETLKHEEAEIRKMAAWCVGTAVQNNEKSQEKALEAKAIPELIRVAKEDTDATVRRKAVYAVSSCVRNYQPALDQLVGHLPAEVVGADEKIDAGDMDKIDVIIAHLRQA